MKIFFINLVAILIIISKSAVDKDLVDKVPGYVDFSTKVYSGYLNVYSTSRSLHYVFVESISGSNNTDPVTLWLNGGPGCSSLLGFLQQIGPFYLQDGKNYTVGDNLTRNPYSWHNASNLLFIETPAGVGYSFNSDPTYQYNDANTAQDNLAALLDFFNKYPEYRKNPFWIAGESYAGKYIPDLAVLIDHNNYIQVQAKINLLGLLIGNGVMNFRNNQLYNSQAQYMMNHQFIDPELIPYFNRACSIDPASAGCRYFQKSADSNVDEINPYNVYDYCWYDNYQDTLGLPENYHSQQSILKQFAKNRKFKNDGKVFMGDKLKNNYNGAPCAYFTGLKQYFNAHASNYHAQTGLKWNGPCAANISQKYSIDVDGSLQSYKHLLGVLQKYHIILYNGDWDAVVPYKDTIKNLQKLKLVQNRVYTPFFVNDQHAGFMQLYSGISFILMKGASHQVPQSKRAQAYFLFEIAMNSHGDQQKFKEMILH